jgi:hypothetical protein
MGSCSPGLGGEERSCAPARQGGGAAVLPCMSLARGRKLKTNSEKSAISAEGVC